MKRIIPFLWVMLLVVGVAQAQPPFGQPPQAPKDAIVDAIIKEATENSQLEKVRSRINGWNRAAVSGLTKNAASTRLGCS
jgi:hypothetical protein